MRIRPIVAALAGALVLSTATTPAMAGAFLDHHTLRFEIRGNNVPLAAQNLTLSDGQPGGVLYALTLSLGLDIFGIGNLRIDTDPYAHWAIELINPLDTPLNMQFTLSMPTTRMKSDEWQAAASLMATLNDLDHDGAWLLPTVPTTTGLPGAPTVMQLMDAGVSLKIPMSTLVYFGGAPTDALGEEGLSATADGSASRTWGSSQPVLPEHSWIGPDVAWNTLSLQVGFQISPRDSLVLRAGIDITPAGAAGPGTAAPEPGTIGLTLAGLMLVARGLRRGTAARVADPS